jgi:isochorismate pyruvate lyase
MDEPIHPDKCSSMAEVRAGVDAVDGLLIARLAQRFAYMRAAARIKQDRAQVRDETRKAEVIANVRAEAEALGLPADAIGDLWDRLIEVSIAYEMDAWERLRDQP